MTDRPIEIRLHGRGGQGTVTFAALVVDAAFRSGRYAIGFPTFGTERTGAPVAAFVRIADEPVRDRSEVRTPSIVVVQDPTLIDAVDVADGLADGGTILINAAAPPPSLPSAVAVPVTDLAIEHLGKAITSTAMLGAFAAICDLVDLEKVCDAIRARFGEGETGRSNESAARAAFALARKEVAA